MPKKIGMFGGKFLPLHKGHLYCIDTASRECDIVYAILFANGTDELEIRKNDKPEYSVESRFFHLKKYAIVILMLSLLLLTFQSVKNKMEQKIGMQKLL